MKTPVVITRSQWGARPWQGEIRGLGAVRQIVLHHAPGFVATTRHEGARPVLAMQKLHQGPQSGRCDIGYHFLVDAGGHVYQGRPYFRGESLADLPQFALGEHLRNVDAHKLGICLLGCFQDDGDRTGDTPSPEALKALECLLWFLCRQYAIRPTDILTHRDFVPGVVCPGEKLYVAIGRLRNQLANAAGESLRWGPAPAACAQTG